MNVLRDVWANYRDESFILQFLSPKLVRQFGLFHVMDDASEPNLRVEAIHDERGYRKIKQALAKHYDVSWTSADIQVVDVNLAGDRRLILHHRARTACCWRRRMLGAHLTTTLTTNLPTNMPTDMPT